MRVGSKIYRIILAAGEFQFGEELDVASLEGVNGGGSNRLTALPTRCDSRCRKC